MNWNKIRHALVLTAYISSTGFWANRPAPVDAQVQLPGAARHAPHRTHPKASPAKPAAGDEAAVSPKFVPATPPPEDHVIGQTLTLDGAKGLMRFNRAGNGIALTRLTLAGEKLSKPGESCEVNITLDPPLLAEAAGRPEGAVRWRFPVEACPFSADVLDGAVLVSSPHPSCDFIAAGCRVSPVGLWGPPGDSIPRAQIKILEKERVATEAALRDNYKLVMHEAGDDKQSVKTLSASEAAFSSEREISCRDYKNESEHGFCATRITEARALALSAEYTARVAEANARRAEEAAKEAARKAAGEARKAEEAAKKAAAKAKQEAAKAQAEAAKAAALKPASPPPGAAGPPPAPDPVNLLPAPDLALKATPAPAK